MDLTWVDLSSNETGFRIERKEGASGTWELVTEPGANATSYADQGSHLSPGTAYVYRIRALGAEGDSPWSPEDTGTTTSFTVPSAPTILRATGVDYDLVELVWQDNSGNEDGFEIQRKTGTNGTWGEVFRPTWNAQAWNDQTVAASTAYVYRIRAYNAAGVSGWSNEDTGTTLANPAPNPPSGLAAQAISGTQVRLTWLDNSTNETGFEVERSLDGVSGWTPSGGAGVDGVEATVSGLNYGTTYYFRVRAVNSVGPSGWAGPVQATTGQPDVTLILSGPGSASEGSAYTLNLSLTGETQGVSGISIDWGDGTTSTHGATDPSASHIYADGPASRTITARALNGQTEVATATHAVSVANVAPNVSIGGPTSGNPGQPYTLSLSATGDPGTDTIASWFVDWGDGSDPDGNGSVGQTIVGNPASAPHTYTTPGTYTITASATDEDGTYAAAPLVVHQQDASLSFTLVGGTLSITAAAGTPFYLRHAASGFQIYKNTTGTGTALYTIVEPFTNLTVNSGANDTGKLEWVSGAPSLSAVVSNGGALNFIGGGTADLGSLTGTGSVDSSIPMDVASNVDLDGEFSADAATTIGGDLIAAEYLGSFEDLTVGGDVTAGDFNNDGTATVGGDLNVDIPDGDGSAIVNLGTLIVHGDLNGDGEFSNRGTLTIEGNLTLVTNFHQGDPYGGTATITGNVTLGVNLNNDVGCSMTVIGNVTTGHTVVNDGTLMVAGNVSSRNFTNEGTVTLFGDVTAADSISNATGGTMRLAGVADPGDDPGDAFTNNGNFIPFTFGLGIDSNNDGAIDEADDAIEDNPALPGKMIGVNNDDDDGNGTPDFLDVGPLTQMDDELVPMQLDIPEWLSSSDALALGITGNVGAVKVWADQQKSQLISFGGPLTMIEDVTVWVEAVAASTSLADIVLTLQTTPAGATRPATDPVRATAPGVDLDISGVGEDKDHIAPGGVVPIADAAQANLVEIYLSKVGSSNAGKIKLRGTNSGTGRIKVWTDETRQNEIDLASVEWDPNNTPLKLIVEGTAASSASGDVQLELIWTGAPGGPDAKDLIKITISGVDIDVDRLNETTEDQIGGAVARRADENNAPRRKVILRPSALAANQILTRSNGKVRIFTAEDGGNELTFDGTDNKFVANQETALWIQGDAASDGMRDDVLTLTPEGGNVSDTVDFTVVWVAVSARLQGQISANNSARQTFRDHVHTTTLQQATQAYAGPENTAAVTHKASGAIEFVGAVSPADLSYYGIGFDRDAQGADYVNDQPVDPVVFSNNIPPGNDPSSPEFRDDIVDDGKIYDLDGPGVNVYVNDEPVGTIKRQRLNFKQYATFEGVRVSEIFKWHVAHSFKKQLDGTWVRDNAIAGDNKFGEGWLNKLTWNLQ